MGWGALENLGQSIDFITCYIVSLVTHVILLSLLHIFKWVGELKRIWAKQSIDFIAIFSSVGIELQKRLSWEPLQKH